MVFFELPELRRLTRPALVHQHNRAMLRSRLSQAAAGVRETARRRLVNVHRVFIIPPPRTSPVLKSTVQLAERGVLE